MHDESDPPGILSSELVGHYVPSKIHPTGYRLDRPRKAWPKNSNSEAPPTWARTSRIGAHIVATKLLGDPEVVHGILVNERHLESDKIVASAGRCR